MNANAEFGLPPVLEQHNTNQMRQWGEHRPLDRQARSLQATKASRSGDETNVQIDSMVGSIEPGAYREDLLKDERHTAGTIGITISSDSNALSPMHVMSVLLGGPAYISGQIAEGDEVIAVDGKRAVDKESLLDQIRTPDLLGSSVLLTLKRGKMQLDVPLVRTSAAHVQDVSTTFDLLKQLSSMVEQMAPAEDFLSTLQMLILHSVDMERNRLEYEEQLAHRVAELQDRLQRKENLVAEMIQEITRLKAVPKSVPSFNSANGRAFNAQLGIPDTSPPQAPQNVAFIPTQEEIEQLENERAEMKAIKRRNEYLENAIAETTSASHINRTALEEEMAVLHNKMEEALLAKSASFEAQMQRKTEELYTVFQEQLDRKSKEAEQLRQRLAKAEQELAAQKELVMEQRRASAEHTGATAEGSPRLAFQAAEPTPKDPGPSSDAAATPPSAGEDSVAQHLSAMISRVEDLKKDYPSPDNQHGHVGLPQQSHASPTDTNPVPKLPLNMVPSPPPKAYPQTPPASAGTATTLTVQPVVHARPRPPNVPSVRLPAQPSEPSPREQGGGSAREQEEWGLHTVLRQFGHSASSGSSVGAPDSRARKAGIGMLLHKPLGTEFPYVKDIVPGGAAHRNGRIRKGEILLAIDQTAVGGLPLNVVVEKICGMEGTTITLTLQRDAGTGKDVFSVSLIRESSSSPNRVSTDASVRASIQATAETVFRPWDHHPPSDVDLTRQVSPRPVEVPPDSSQVRQLWADTLD